jgi:hypothetical protein
MIGLRWASGFLGIVGLAAGAPAQPEGKSPLPSLDGAWEVKVSSTLFGDDGTKTTSKLTIVIEFEEETEGGGLTVRSFPLAFDTVLFPETDGERFTDYFFARNTDEEQIATLAGTVKVDSESGEGKSFSATATLATDDGVLVATLKGKRLSSSVSNAILLADFEGGLTPYTETDSAGTPAPTLWHAEGFCDVATPIPSPMGTMAAAYNQGDVGNFTFNTGDTNSGVLQGPSLAVPSGTRGVQIVFDTLREGELGPPFDQSFVEVRAVGAADWTSLGQILDQRPCGSSEQVISIGIGKSTASSLLGSNFSHRFRFDTVDSVANNFIGWYVDNVEVRVFQ